MGIEPNGDSVIVVVLERGYDKEFLEWELVQTDAEMLAQIAEKVLTPGVWKSLWS